MTSLLSQTLTTQMSVINKQAVNAAAHGGKRHIVKSCDQQVRLTQTQTQSGAGTSKVPISGPNTDQRGHNGETKQRNAQPQFHRTSREPYQFIKSQQQSTVFTVT